MSLRVFARSKFLIDRSARITGIDPESLAAKEFAKFDANAKQILADMFVDMSIDAGEKLSTIKAAGLSIKNTAPEGGRQYKVVAPFTDNNGVQYDSAVLLDTAFFDGLSPRNWGTQPRDFVKYRAATDPFIIPILDENGNIQQLEFAKPGDRVKKTGKADHAVLSELSNGTDNISIGYISFIRYYLYFSLTKLKRRVTLEKGLVIYLPDDILLQDKLGK